MKLKTDLQPKHIDLFKNYNWQNATDDNIMEFAKADDFPEPGISINELACFIEGLKAADLGVYLETGMCYGTTTRAALAYCLRQGKGDIYSCEFKVREAFKAKMVELDYWDLIDVLEGDSMKIPWNKDIDFLFIDSEHNFDDALGEYMRYRRFLSMHAIVGFHDSSNCPGVIEALKVIHSMDELELIAESNMEDDASTGIKIYRLKALNVMFNAKAAELRKELDEKNRAIRQARI